MAQSMMAKVREFNVYGRTCRNRSIKPIMLTTVFLYVCLCGNRAPMEQMALLRDGLRERANLLAQELSRVMQPSLLPLPIRLEDSIKSSSLLAPHIHSTHSLEFNQIILGNYCWKV